MPNPKFLQKLQDQLRYIQTSAGLYDCGQEAEAHRLAVSMRVLFHNTARQTSLCRRLKRDTDQMLSTVPGSGKYQDFIGFKINLGSRTPVTCCAKLGDQFFPTSLQNWFNGEVIHHFEGTEYHRRDFILTACDQDGGAHVDEKLERFYEDLIAHPFIGLHGADLKYPGAAPYDQTQPQFPRNTHLAMIRQFAHEVLASAHHFNWLGVQP